MKYSEYFYNFIRRLIGFRFITKTRMSALSVSVQYPNNYNDNALLLAFMIYMWIPDDLRTKKTRSCEHTIAGKIAGGVVDQFSTNERCFSRAFFKNSSVGGAIYKKGPYYTKCGEMIDGCW
jgi:hypothetical protein